MSSEFIIRSRIRSCKANEEEKEEGEAFRHFYSSSEHITLSEKNSFHQTIKEKKVEIKTKNLFCSRVTRGDQLLNLNTYVDSFLVFCCTISVHLTRTNFHFV